MGAAMVNGGVLSELILQNAFAQVLRDMGYVGTSRLFIRRSLVPEKRDTESTITVMAGNAWAEFGVSNNIFTMPIGDTVHQILVPMADRIRADQKT
jgi:hypothetical protein